MNILKFVFVFCLLGLFAPSYVGATGTHPVVPSVASGAAVAAPIAPQVVDPSSKLPSGETSLEYVLGIGDRIRLTVYGEEDLSGEYEVGSTGGIALPLIGNIQAANLTLQQFMQAVRTKLSDGYLHDPRVNAQVANYRPFFILGEVARPGSYPFVNGMTVLNAVALAGGYTYRSDKSGATIVHANDPTKKEQSAGESEPVAPGDIVRVPERFF